MRSRWKRRWWFSPPLHYTSWTCSKCLTYPTSSLKFRTQWSLGLECVYTHSKNRECVSSLRERVPAVGPRLNSLSLGEHSPYKGTWCRNCELGRNVSYFRWLSRNLSKEEPRQRTECKWKKEKVLESGDLQTSLGLPTVTLGDSELQSTDPGPVPPSVEQTKSSINSILASQFCHACFSAMLDFLSNSVIKGSIKNIWVIVGRAHELAVRAFWTSDVMCLSLNTWEQLWTHFPQDVEHLENLTIFFFF